jgi:hypothetical protein
MSDDLTIRFFTLAQANEALEIVRPILLDLKQAHDGLDQARQRYAGFATQLQRFGLLVEWHRIEQEIETLLERIQHGIETVAALGIELKNIEQGLVDFPALRNGQVVYLCYRLDEPEVTAWHPIHTGFAGRQPVDDAFDA